MPIRKLLKINDANTIAIANKKMQANENMSTTSLNQVCNKNELEDSALSPKRLLTFS
jgi:hypothetical protein